MPNALISDLVFAIIPRVIDSKWFQDRLDDGLEWLGLQRKDTMKAWTVPAKVNRVVDGDTLRCTLDLGWGISLEQYVQLVGIQAPEIRTNEGRDSLAFVEGLISPGDEVTVVSRVMLGQTEKYGRVLAAVRLADGRDLSTEILAADHAQPYQM